MGEVGGTVTGGSVTVAVGKPLMRVKCGRVWCHCDCRGGSGLVWCGLSCNLSHCFMLFRNSNHCCMVLCMSSRCCMVLHVSNLLVGLAVLVVPLFCGDEEGGNEGCGQSVGCCAWMAMII